VREVVRADASPAPTGATLVVLDDAGAHRCTATKCDRLFAWADRLYSARVPVLVTSNMRPSELAEAVTRGTGDPYAGERIVRRLRGDLAGELVEVGGGRPRRNITTADQGVA
jgi:DNA replication protein DnaC